MPTIHIAGFPVRVGTVQRQRCAWCGEVLIDYDLANMMVAPGDGAPAGPNVWAIGKLVAIDNQPGLRGSWIVRHEDGDNLPAGWCGDERPQLRLV